MSTCHRYICQLLLSAKPKRLQLMKLRQLLRLVKVVRVLSSSFHSLFFQKLKVQVATTFLIWGPIVEVVLITPFGDMKLSFAVPVKVLLVRILPFAVSAFSVHFNGVPSAIPFREMKPPQNQP